LRISFSAELMSFIEEQRATVGGTKQPQMFRAGAAECATLVTEQFAPDESPSAAPRSSAARKAHPARNAAPGAPASSFAQTMQGTFKATQAKKEFKSDQIDAALVERLPMCSVKLTSSAVDAVP
jgi:hypothetical protein